MALSNFQADRKILAEAVSDVSSFYTGSQPPALEEPVKAAKTRRNKVVFKERINDLDLILT